MAGGALGGGLRQVEYWEVVCDRWIIGRWSVTGGVLGGGFFATGCIGRWFV